LTKLYANAKLVENMRIDVDDGRTHALCLDLPSGTGTDRGPSALELALMSYAGCYATIFAMTAKKSRIPLKDLKVAAEATKPEAVGTITEVKFDVTVKSDAPTDRIQRIHKLTLQSCPVGKIFEKAGVKATYNLRAEKE